jgi:hypothetical protein
MMGRVLGFGGSTRTVLLLGALALFALLALGRDGHASGNQFLTWEDGSSFTTFGANASITIQVGAMATDCADPIFPTTDIYVVPSGSAGGGTLSDVSGSPNVVIGTAGGGFAGETIGFTNLRCRLRRVPGRAL